MKKHILLIILVIVVLGIYIYYKHDNIVINDVVEKDYIEINNNVPYFTDEDYDSDLTEEYRDLDRLGRATFAYAKVSKDTMPTGKRGSISSVKPTGWHSVKYDIVDGKYLYNRCHLIGFQLTGENANKKNLITCTRKMNTKTMLPFENEVAEYVKNSNDSVLYRVTVSYDEDDLLAKGIYIEASSVSDRCSSICFNVFIYNIQDGIVIDYKTGDSFLKS